RSSVGGDRAPADARGLHPRCLRYQGRQGRGLPFPGCPEAHQDQQQSRRCQEFDYASGNDDTSAVDAGRAGGTRNHRWACALVSGSRTPRRFGGRRGRRTGTSVTLRGYSVIGWVLNRLLPLVPAKAGTQEQQTEASESVAPGFPPSRERAGDWFNLKPNMLQAAANDLIQIVTRPQLDEED